MSHTSVAVAAIVALVLLGIAFVMFPWIINSLSDEAAKERWFSWQLILTYAVAYLLFGFILYELTFYANTPLWLIMVMCLVGVGFVVALGNRSVIIEQESLHDD